MRRILSVISLCALAFAAPRPTQDDFNACFEKNLPSMVNVAGHSGIALSPNLIAVVKNEDMPLRNYIKFDPFLGLYLVASDTKLEPVKLSDETKAKKSDWLSSTSEANSTLYGHLKSMGERLGEPDTLTFEPASTLAILSACCNLRGISIGGGKFIPSRYLKHFMAYQDVYYGDVGAVFEMNETKFIVKSVDQLGRGQALLSSDEILSINGEKFKSLREFNERILFAKKGEILTFEVLRDGEVHKFDIAVSNDKDIIDKNIKEVKQKPEVKEIVKSAQIVNTAKDFFKLQGITLDKNLVVKKVDSGSKAAKFGIKSGDKLLQIDKSEVKTYKEALNLTSKEKSQNLLLFRRGEFDFFYKAR